MSLTPPPSGHGLSPREQQIIDLDEAGVPAIEIAARLQLKPRHVYRTIKMYDGSMRVNERFDAMVVAGTMALASAIAQTGKAFS
jgi:DNA-binding NarL/FixJ family response regulator